MGDGGTCVALAGGRGNFNYAAVDDLSYSENGHMAGAMGVVGMPELPIRMG